MRRLKLEKISGVVALAYLVLIPAGAIYAWQRIKQMDDDLSAIWHKLEMPPTERESLFDLAKAKERFLNK